MAYVLRQADSGTPVEDVCRGMGISQATFYIWKKKFGELSASEVRHLRQLEVDRACQQAQFSRAGWYRRSQAKDQSALRIGTLNTSCRMSHRLWSLSARLATDSQCFV